MQNELADVNVRRHTTTETSHGREETRTDVQMSAPKDLTGISRWAGLKTIGIAIVICTRSGKETVDIRYFISSLGIGIPRFSNAVRSHWGIENSCHWCLDVTYREDESMIREKHLRIKRPGSTVRSNLAGKEPTLGFGKDEKGDPIPMKGGITVVDGTPQSPANVEIPASPHPFAP